ncbi:MAG: GGDEF domain-containing protein [Lachnospiraceae bacterium]|nr:GGDEF domain-containing protein [Lachnospiraceae bacterium]
MDPYSVFFLEAHIVCIILYFIILNNVRHSEDRQQSVISFAHTLIGQMIYFVVNTIWFLTQRGAIPVPQIVTSWLLVIDYSISCILAWQWFAYSESVMKSKLVATPKGRKLTFIPVGFTALLIIVLFSLSEGFYFDLSGEVINPAVYGVILIVPFGYVFYSAINAFKHIRDNRYSTDRPIYVALIYFPIIIIIGGTLQSFFYFYPFMCFSCLLAIFNVYIRFLRSAISIDSLTGINNRHQFDYYLAKKLAPGNEVASFNLVMIDIDYFKQINDKFGHTEGDHALMLVGEALRKSCTGDTRCFVARYGGDEFVVTMQNSTETEIKDMMDSIQKNLDLLQKENRKGYNIKLCFGVAGLAPGRNTPAELIKAADKELYKQKQLTHIASPKRNDSRLSAK